MLRSRASRTLRWSSVAAFGVASAILATASSGQAISGQLQQWNKTTLTFDGPTTSETTGNNPFLNYRLEVDFTSPDGSRTITVPGFYAGDGAGGAAGNKWRAHFMPDAVGQWSYSTRFETGSNVAVANGFGTGSTAAFHGTDGLLNIGASDKTGRDFRSAERGLIKNRGHHYLTYGGSGNVWIKGGAGIPENFLGYYGFDNTSSLNTVGPVQINVPSAEQYLHRYGAHAGDWNVGDPDWSRNDGAQSTRSNAGRNIIGAINYLASTGANSIYFLPMNLGGDGQDTHPFIGTGSSDKTRYDLSKLEQWETFFEHAQSKGVFLHFILAETENANENFFDNGQLGTERKLFYRELAARFGHHPGLEWNIGEENDFGADRRLAFAQYIKSVDPYDHPIANHIKTNVFSTYDNLLGTTAFDMSSFQTDNSAGTLAARVEEWRQKSADAGVPWVISVDEPQAIHDDKDDQNLGYPSIRRRFTWPTYLSGGGGFEMYVQRDGGGHGLDARLDDLSKMELGLTEIGHALKFLEELPLLEMSPADALLRGEDSDFGGAQVMAKIGEIYAIYIPDASNDDNSNTKGEILAGQNGPPELDLRGFGDDVFELRWYNPRTGQYIGPATEIFGGDWRSIGVSPDGFRSTNDWALTVRLIPEPGTFALLAPGGIVVIARRRSRS